MLTLNDVKVEFEFVSMFASILPIAPIFEKVVGDYYVHYKQIGERAITDDDYDKNDQVDYRKFIVCW